MLHLAGRSPVAAHEDVFLARYRALVLVALRVTDGNRAEAEDLVHEAFVRFTLVQPPLDDVRDLDAYLSRMLRNMYTSRIRRRLRAAETSLSILDYDSLDIGLHVMDASRQLEVRELLRAACEYGCLRRRSSKTGSVFLFRFFHGYLPGEIAEPHSTVLRHRRRAGVPRAPRSPGVRRASGPGQLHRQAWLSPHWRSGRARQAPHDPGRRMDAGNTAGRGQSAGSGNHGRAPRAHVPRPPRALLVEEGAPRHVPHPVGGGIVA